MKAKLLLLIFLLPLASCQPIASFNINNQNGLVTVDARASYSNSKIIAYDWDWESNRVFDANGMKAEHYYEKDGVYLITLKVTDENNKESTIEQSVSIRKQSSATPLLRPTGFATRSIWSKLFSFFDSLFN